MTSWEWMLLKVMAVEVSILILGHVVLIYFLPGHPFASAFGGGDIFSSFFGGGGGGLFGGGGRRRRKGESFLVPLE